MSRLTQSLPVEMHARTACAKELAERFFYDSERIIEKKIAILLDGTGLTVESYIRRNPALCAALIQSQAIAFHALVVAEAIGNIRDAISQVSETGKAIEIKISCIENCIEAMLDPAISHGVSVEGKK